ncbi:purine-nucleoside phosphorylase [Pyrobaculum neutrophilum]|uniref:Purine or other phosphorylase family 1 n=1 Tax=Pyrobaculum neutrophilum (strain DSM 2338 / JCM 9278 / NBRC 100436 / V24Sta) TaxID=444157 RepID=B1YCM9_PYRNV|nr:purine-nucleoside phosphorylase [Pyrobaculum neutrophilum]ACB39542.1 purine or other phosphorylase family 1 [Pyrobaculum neutrophilum V24Sta]
MPYHIWARPGEVAPVVVGVGDPARARLFASLLEEAKLVNENRYPVYTGRAGGRAVSVVAHGIGGPSAAIALEELRTLGMEVFVRIGTAGSFGDLKVGDVLVAAAAAAPQGGLLNSYFPGFSPPLSADPRLTVRLAEALGAPVGYVVSSDAFYAEDPQFVEFWRRRGALAVEMECATAMALGWLRGFRTGCVLVVSNVVGRHEVVDLRERFVEVFRRVVEAVA